jgi:hypothetical protein
MEQLCQANKMDDKLHSKPGIRTIGIRGCGPGTGKDTATSKFIELLSKNGYEFKHKKFATPIRKVMEVLLGNTVEELETIQCKNKIIPEMGITVGQCMQKLGTVLRESLYQGVIVDSLMREIDDQDNIIISDIRMKIEQNAVIKRNGIVIYIDSNREIDKDALAGRSITHETERDLDGVSPDYIIKNDGTIEDLHKKIRELVEKLFPNKGLKREI